MKNIMAVGVIILAAGVLLILPIIKHTVTREIIHKTVITGKERIVETDNEGRASSKYLIFTKNETFENTDSLWGWKFNSSDVYGKIKEGQICTFKVVGWRLPLLSWYRNILKAECSHPNDIQVPSGS